MEPCVGRAGLFTVTVLGVGRLVPGMCRVVASGLPGQPSALPLQPAGSAADGPILTRVAPATPSKVGRDALHPGDILGGAHYA